MNTRQEVEGSEAHEIFVFMSYFLNFFSLIPDIAKKFGTRNTKSIFMFTTCSNHPSLNAEASSNKSQQSENQAVINASSILQTRMQNNTYQAQLQSSKLHEKIFGKK